MLIFKKSARLLLVVIIFIILGLVSQVLAEEIILNDLAGQSVHLSSFRGKPVILLFWTTWCPYCRSALTIINRQHSLLSKEGIVVLGVNVGESNYKVQRFIKSFSLNFKILLDTAGLLANQYDLPGVPTYIFLDNTGKEISRANRLPDNYRDLLFK